MIPQNLHSVVFLYVAMIACDHAPPRAFGPWGVVFLSVYFNLYLAYRPLLTSSSAPCCTKLIAGDRLCLCLRSYFTRQTPFTLIKIFYAQGILPLYNTAWGYLAYLGCSGEYIPPPPTASHISVSRML